MKIKNSLFFFTLLISASNIFAQQVKMNPFAVKSSGLFDELKAYKIANPKISPEDFMKAANSLLEAKGLNFTIAFDSATCQKIEKAKNNRKNPDAPLNLRTAIKSISGEAASLALPEPIFGQAECFSCYIYLPILQITDSDFVTIIDNKNVGFFLPANFAFNEVKLVDEDLVTVKRKWRIPTKLKPISISDDGKLLYLEFSEPELNDLVLLSFSEGVYQFDLRKNLDSRINSEILKIVPKNAETPNFSFIKFTKEGKWQTLKFPTYCPN